MEMGDLRPILEKNISLLKEIARHTRCMECADSEGDNGSGVECTVAGINESVPAGLKSVAIIKTNDTGTATVTFTTGTYDLTLEGEGISDNASVGLTLPAYAISTGDGGEWKWHGVGCL